MRSLARKFTATNTLPTAIAGAMGLVCYLPRMGGDAGGDPGSGGLSM